MCKDLSTRLHGQRLDAVPDRPILLNEVEECVASLGRVHYDLAKKVGTDSVVQGVACKSHVREGLQIVALNDSVHHVFDYELDGKAAGHRQSE